MISSLAQPHFARLALCALLPVAGCAPAHRAGLASEYPLERARAAVAAADAGDAGAIHKLVDLLGDEDGGVRLYAFLALQRLTGRDYEYEYYAPEPDRAAAIARWQEALRRGEVTLQPSPATEPAAAPAAGPTARRTGSEARTP